MVPRLLPDHSAPPPAPQAQLADAEQRAREAVAGEAEVAAALEAERRETGRVAAHVEALDARLGEAVRGSSAREEALHGQVCAHWRGRRCVGVVHVQGRKGGMYA